MRRLARALAAPFLVVILAAAAAAGDAPSPARLLWQQGERIKALESIAAARNAGERDLVEQALAGQEGAEVAHAIRALRAIAPLGPDDLDLLEPLLAHPAAAARLEAAQAMVAGDNDLAVPALIAQAQNPDAAWREPMVQAVRALVRTGLPTEVSEWDAWWRGSAAKADQALLAAEPALAGSDPARTVAAIRDLIAYRQHRSMIVPRLTRLLEHPDPAVSGAARAAIKDLGGPFAREIAARSATRARPATAPAMVAVQAGPVALPKWVVPAGILATLVLVVVLVGFTPAGRKVREGTGRIVRRVAEKPGVTGATARIARRSGDLVAKGTQAIRKAARHISWGGK
ncbi:MAG: hypothetical protein RLZZ127_1808 [Planctomycetota bacterium]|jgi:hypothetical protein